MKSIKKCPKCNGKLVKRKIGNLYYYICTVCGYREQTL